MLAAGGLLASTAVGSAGQFTLLMAGVAVLGAPHGVLDLKLLAEVGGRRARVAWVIAYLALIVVVLAGWRFAPASTLVLFLVAAALHFGLEQAPAAPGGRLTRTLQVAARGATVVVPLVFLAPEAAPILARLAGAPLAAVQAELHACTPPALAAWSVAAALALCQLCLAGAWAQATELALLAGLFACTPPILAFAVYFTLVHATGHIARTLRLVGPVEGARTLPWLAAWLAPAILACSLGVLWLQAHAADQAQTVAWSLRVLAALALPHLALGPALEAHAARRPLALRPRPHSASALA